ncbi:Uncharacterized protein OS=Isosphaera pallida (strain ATCC 43644 / DSM 9630 / IS1B) GN=Isop_2427 PE=4 SV=1 [Gemmataceae bacterium]|nr:Uncharacterized protein OS=Isosphaera pallida (strain ATCC 43644 / DSM 9630 / IS1B) GN=Isop_2427 PE=4 SV=1 [Gemmataceae bacterium]VTU00997.1 Uncharacterized protein OS=Isosphaera pallida (strain ATCC 43644 / DSM 9630 / IS1B) GN=Isop_2427 PE=4 SV=1 [Gemmataceae bacterium]
MTTNAPPPLPNTFTDAEGHEWRLRLTVGAVADVKRDAGVDIGGVTRSDAAWLRFLFGEDPGPFVATLWALCAGQAAAAGVTPEQFAHRLDGPALEAAGAALAGAIADFFPRSRIARALREGIARVIEATDARAEAEIRSRTEAFCTSATSAPESAGSTPAG